MSEAAPASPLKAVLDIRRDEIPLALSMAGYFFLVITTFWILKPIKKGLFIEFYDKAGVQLLGFHLQAAEAEQLAKVLNMLAAIVAMVTFTWLSRRLSRQQLTYAFSAFFLTGFLGYALLFAHPGHFTVWTFYLYGDLYSTVMVATFFAFLNDSVTPAEAKRLYGVIVLGGVAGGAFGSSIVRSWIEELGRGGWMWICLGIGLVIVVLAGAAGRLVTTKHAKDEPVVAATKPKDPEVHGNPALEGARLVLKSRYLLAIVTIVALYEIISTTLDFQFTQSVGHYLDGGAIGKHISTVYMITNIVSLVVQLFLTSFVMSRLSLTAALLITPVAILGGSGLFLLLPLLWPGSLLSISDNSLNYSMNQSAREALYTRTNRDEKYKAKAFIDMFVQRFAKTLAVGVSLTLSQVFKSFESLRWLSVFAAVLVVIWIFAARYAGKRFDELSAQAEAVPQP